MNKKLTFTDNGKNYTLEFTRASVIATENAGFDIRRVAERPITSVVTLWRGAFLANHPTLKLAEIDALLERVDNENLLDALIELYNAPIESLFDEDHSKNAIKWTVN